MKVKHATSIGLILALIAGSASADVSIYGFGQVVVGSTLGNNPDHAFPGYTNPPANPITNPTGAVDTTHSSYTADPSFTPESLFALQVVAPLTDRFSATAQILASGQDGNDFAPKFNWAYVTYQLADSWSIRAGRQRLPVYVYSDYLQVGTAYPWLRPPLSVYGSANALNIFDGVSLSGSYGLGAWDIRPEIYYGGFSGAISEQGTTASITLHNISGFTLDSTYDRWFTLSTRYAIAKATADLGGQFDQLLAGLDAAGLSGVASGLDINNSTTTYADLGFEIDKYKLFLNGEYNLVKVNGSGTQRFRNYYVSAGSHFGRFTPMVSFSHEDQASSNAAVVDQASSINLGIPVTPLECQAPLDQGTALQCLYNGVVSAVQAQRRLDDYYQIGARYDLTRNTALKIDFTRFINSIPSPNAAATPPSANLLSAAFVFTF